MGKFIEESWLVLTMGVVFACLLAGTQMSFSDAINANKQKALNEAIGEVVTGFETTEALEIDGNDVYKCLDSDGQLVGWAVVNEGGGFVDKIKLVVGITPDGGKVTGIKVFEQLETPGLGNKIETDPEWYGQYADLSTGKKIEVKKGGARHENNEIDGITGATWSSRYVSDILNDVFVRIVPKLAENR